MNLREGITTILCVIVLFILVAVLFIVKDKMDNKNKVTNKENNETTIIINYNVDGGESISSSTIKKGETIVLPTPTRKGYKFAGWYVNGKLVDEYTRFDSNTTIVAKWILIGSPYEGANNNNNNDNNTNNQQQTNPNKSPFTVTFDSKGGSKVNSMSVVCNNEPINLPIPTRKGYAFKGWVDKNGNGVGNGSIVRCEDINLYATWEVEEEPATKTIYSDDMIVVHFDSRGGTQVADMVTLCIPNQALSFPHPTKAGYLFNGWYDANGRAFLDGAILTCGEITLYASWSTLPQPTMTPAPITW